LTRDLRFRGEHRKTVQHPDRKEQDVKQSPLQLWIAIWQRQLQRALVVVAVLQVLTVAPWETPLV
jgi:hypothetical protein